MTRVWTPTLLERVLQRQRIQDGGEHAHVVGGGAVHALAAGRQPAPDVAAADDDRDLRRRCASTRLIWLARLCDDGGIDAERGARPSAPRR